MTPTKVWGQPLSLVGVFLLRRNFYGKQLPSPVRILVYMLKWLVITAILGIFMGSLSAFFLNSLTVVTDIRLSHPWLLCLLPVSGALFAYLYAYHGGLSSRGNNLVIDQGNGGEEKIPLRLIPLTLFGTITTHLFGDLLAVKEQQSKWGSVSR